MASYNRTTKQLQSKFLSTWRVAWLCFEHLLGSGAQVKTAYYASKGDHCSASYMFTLKDDSP
eukprot:m.98141 g.98141  ORF g.98141 m.98141 type:complete len:62 (-) comp13116_c0_seq6:283-468(-)